MNKYLEKIAEEPKKKPSLVGTGLEAGAGTLLASKVPSHLLGYHTLYHGTSKERANSINKTGFDPKHGGTGAAGHSGAGGFKENSKDKVHFTKSKGTAKFFAGYTQFGDNHKGFKGNPTLHHFKGMGHGFANQFLGIKGKVLKTRVTNEDWDKNFTADPDMGNVKFKAATTDKKIDASKLNNKRRSFANKENLSKYYNSKSGKMRAVRGVGLGLVGTGLLAHAVIKRLNTKHE